LSTAVSELAFPIQYALLAEALLLHGDQTAAWVATDAGLAAVARNGEEFYEPELHRLRAEIVLSKPAAASPAAVSAEAHYREAIRCAESQGALLLQLRAALGLGTLLVASGRHAEVSAMVTPLYETLPPGSDFPEASAARRLLAAVCEPSNPR